MSFVIILTLFETFDGFLNGVNEALQYASLYIVAGGSSHSDAQGHANKHEQCSGLHGHDGIVLILDANNQTRLILALTKLSLLCEFTEVNMPNSLKIFITIYNKVSIF